MFEFEVFRKQMYCIEENACDIVWTFGAPQSFATPRSGSALPAIIRRPGIILCPPSLRPCDRITVSWF